WLKIELCCQWQHGIKNNQRVYLGLPEGLLVKNELYCPRLHGTKRPLIENLIFGLRILHCDFWIT
ncbi:TPA: hypothetical protein ACGH3Y_003282, partial [Salmonella enterica subsp. enterica serovar 1,4,[5],12:i:-]